MNEPWTDDIRPDRAHLLIGCGVVAAAALTAIWAPLNLVLIVSLFALLRVCWLEDNITNDLIGRDSLPGGYVNTAIRRGNFLRLWFGHEPAEDASKMRPHHLATVMRAEIQVWACMMLGIAATTVALVGPLGLIGNLVLGGGVLIVALRRVDRLMVSLAHCAEGRALPRASSCPRRGARRISSSSDPRPVPVYSAAMRPRAFRRCRAR
jgi:hypothetical protein